MNAPASLVPTLQVRAADVLLMDPMPLDLADRLADVSEPLDEHGTRLAFWPDLIVAPLRFPPGRHGRVHAYIDGCLLRCAVGMDIIAALERARRPRATLADVDADISHYGALVNAAAVPKPEPIPEADVVRLATVDTDEFPGPRRIVQWPNGLAAIVVPNPTPDALRRAYAQARAVRAMLVLSLAMGVREAHVRAEAQWTALNGDVPRGAA